jgi:hypothetical protein
MTKRNIIISIFIATVIAGIVFIPKVALAAGSCGGAETSVISCEGEGSTAIINIIKQVIKILTAGVGVAAFGAVVYGAFLYTTSEGSPDKVKKAREVWMNTVIGLLMFAFMVAITNFIIPGGVFN